MRIAVAGAVVALLAPCARGQESYFLDTQPLKEEVPLLSNAEPIIPPQSQPQYRTVQPTPQPVVHEEALDQSFKQEVQNRSIHQPALIIQHEPYQPDLADVAVAATPKKHKGKVALLALFSGHLKQIIIAGFLLLIWYFFLKKAFQMFTIIKLCVLWLISLLPLPQKRGR